MSRRTKLFILIGAIIVILIIFLILLFRFLAKPAPETVVITGPQEQVELPTNNQQEIINQQAMEQEIEVRTNNTNLRSQSVLFAERYGSFSSESNNENLVDLLPQMTDAFAAETQAYINSQTAPTEYYGVTTRVLSVQVEEMNEETGLATALVKTQREEAKGSTQNITVKYQNLRLTFEFIQGSWKVSSANWE